MSHKAKLRLRKPPRPAASDAVFAAEIGRRIRRMRARRGMTRRQLAEESRVSERYLAQIEAGLGNPSVTVLKAIAEAMESSVLEFIPAAAGGPSALGGIVDSLHRVAHSELPQLGQLIEQWLSQREAFDRGRRIALVGVRGAGKSSLGELLARELSCPFLEIDKAVEEEYGATVSTLIEMSGIGAFRRYERACLEQVIARHQSVVIATAGGIVSNAETYALLLRRTHVIWVKARPEVHMKRVMEQGDFRPMARNREAMADLKAILEARAGDYAKAEAELDTSDLGIAQGASRLAGIARRLLAPVAR